MSPSTSAAETTMQQGALQPHRSLLFVPAHRDGWVAKALRVDVDALILDLEDAVPASAKSDARAMVAPSADLVRTTAPHVGVLVRCNGAEDPGNLAHDLEAAVLAGVDAVLVPKVARPQDVARVRTVMSHIAQREGTGVPAIMASLETAAGLLHCGRIMAHPAAAGALCAAARDGDVARSVGFTWTAEGMETLAYRSRVVLACRAADRHPVVGLWQELGDLDGLARFAAANSGLGFRGQVVIHPSHVEAVNAAYTPSDAALEYYRGMVQEWETAGPDSGAVRYRGDHIDAAHVATARQVLEVADRIRR